MGIDGSMFQNTDMTPVMSPQNALLQAYQMQHAQQQNALMGLQTQDVHDQRRLAIQKAQEEASRRQKQNALMQGLQSGQKLDPAAAIAAGMSREDIAFLANSGTLGMSKVARTIERVGPGGMPETVSVDEFNRPVGDSFAKPVEQKMADLGGRMQPYNPYTINAPMAKTMTPGDIASNGLGYARLAQEKTQSDASREAQFKISGIDPQTGNFTGAGGAIDGLVEAVGTGKIPLAQATARMPPGVKSQLMAALGEKYPGFDPTDMAQRSRAAVAFGTGKEGNAVRSFNVSLSHLDTLGTLADAMGNGSIPLLNQAKNIYQTQTGNAAPTDFNAAKKIVSDEIVKAIVGSGGGVADREEAAKTISQASSPKQLKGVIETYKELMRGQLGGLERQYQATTGRSDFRSKFLSTEAQANAPGATSALPADVAAALAKHGGK